jgi:SAM-dependent methyltransferase
MTNESPIPTPAPTQTTLDATQKKQLIKLQDILLKKRTWRFLRYIHTRAAMAQLSGVNNVLVVGAGYGFAEIALAIEFPNIHFLLTDWSGSTHDFRQAKQICDAYSLQNVGFDTLDILSPHLPPSSFDLVLSVEVLEHISDDTRAARNISKLSKKNIFTLVSYGSAEQNSAPEYRRKAYKAHEHFRVGYDASSLNTLFPGEGITTGCYWHEFGGTFRSQLNALSDAEIIEQRSSLARSARADLKVRAPEPGQCAGIWRLCETVDLGF